MLSVATTTARLAALLEQTTHATHAIRGNRPGPVWVGCGHENDPSRGVALPRRALHEWLAQAPPQSLWTAAATAAIERHPGTVFWVGPACWPWAAALPAGLRARSVFVNAPRRDQAARVWAADLLLRSPAAAAVIADGRDLSTAASRRLQLAAEAGDALTCLWRVEDERALSVAHYRWRVTPQAHDGTRPRWRVKQLRSKDAAQLRTSALSPDPHGRNPTVFDVELCDAEGLVVVSDPVADRSRSANATPHDPSRRSA